MVKLKIDNYDVEVPAGTSILDAARTVQIEIPTLCKHPDVDPRYISFPDLHRWVCELEEFNDEPNRSNEKILEAIQTYWLEEV